MVSVGCGRGVLGDVIRGKSVPKSILVVDDSAFARRVLRDVLDGAGYQVHEAVNGRDAVEKYSTVSPDLVTMDLAMPGMSGLDALLAIRSLDVSARVLVVSALDRVPAAEDALRAGACEYVRKPFQPAALLDAVRRCLLVVHPPR